MAEHQDSTPPMPTSLQEALGQVTEVPENLGDQAEYFEKVHEALSSKLREG